MKKFMFSALFILMAFMFILPCEGAPSKVSGGAYFFPENIIYRASFSMEVTGSSSPSGWFKYYYTKTRMNFVSTSITSAIFSVNPNRVVFSGTGTVNGVGGYTFTAEAKDSKPDEFKITIFKNGSIYYSAGLIKITGGDLVFQIPTNSPPVAKAGADQTVFVTQVVTLDGSESSDTDGDLLNFRWSLKKVPDGSKAELSDISAIKPTFVVDKPGTYEVELIVNDGQLDSVPDICTITTENSRPVANAGTDQTVYVGDIVYLNGSGSTDVDGDLLTYRWLMKSIPAGSSSTIINETSVYPTFIIDKPGTYEVELIVNDGQLDSVPDICTITTENSRPVANAGPDQTVYVGDIVYLNGSGSTDVDGDPLTFTWSFTSIPPNSHASLSDPSVANPRFTVDLPGIYVVQLIVNDGKIDSHPAKLVITTKNSKPVAEAGQDQIVFVRDVVQLDGSGSKDADGDALSYFWAIINKPTQSGAIINPNDIVNPIFIPDLAGSYIVQLIVNDGKVDSVPDTATIVANLRMVTVPSVVGLSQGLAQLELTKVYLAIGVMTSQHSDTVAEGCVISQNPAAGGTVLEGTPVDLVISLGPVKVPVPDVVGKTQIEAETRITGAGLVVGAISEENSNTVPFGNVISQDPMAGSLVLEYSIVNLVISLGPAGLILPPDPATVAPKLNLTVPTIVFASTEFLYTGPNPIQTGVADGTIEPKRAAVLRGKVVKQDGSPLAGVTLSILNHPQYGQTLSRADGMFDLVVNGGGSLTLHYEKAGFLRAQRQAFVPWQEFVWFPEVVLIPLDPQVTSVDLATPSMQVARGTPQTDADGTRQATLLIPQGTSAQIVMPDGSRQNLTTLNIRATEYTVGPYGLLAMPAELPSNVGYTYCVELTVDEADQSNAKRVEFSQPLPFYIENFLGFFIGTNVPSGYYDRQRGSWIPSVNGRVIKIVGVTGGLADLDVDKNVGADPSLYGSLGITDAERLQLANLYAIGQELWRVPITHFSPWDYNWPYAPPPNATPPKQPSPNQYKPYAEPCRWTGSILECQNQVLGQEISITGTPFNLSYRSNRTLGRKEAYSLDIPLSGETVPSDLLSIQLEISVAGKLFKQAFPADPNQTYTFTWDGKDAYDRYVQGRQAILIRIGYDYPGIYMEPAQWNNAFSAFSQSSVAVSANPARNEITLWQEWKGSIGTWVSNFDLFGGFNLNVHHSYDRQGGVLFKGDGTEYNAEAIGSTIVTRIAGMPPGNPRGDGGLARDAFLDDPRGITVGPDGTIYFVDAGRVGSFTVRAITPNGVINTIPDLANLTWVNEIALGPDGSFYFGDIRDHKIYRYDPVLQTKTTVAGTGVSAVGCEECLATSSALASPESVTVGPDGTIYLTDAYRRIRKIDTNGIITTIAGDANKPVGFSGDGGPASMAILGAPKDLSLGPDGSLYFSDYNNERVRRIGPDGIITTIAGSGDLFCSPYPNCDGIKATDAKIHILESIAITPEGEIYLTDSKRRIRKVSPDGIITGVLLDYGLGPLYNPYFGGEGRPPAIVQFYPRHLAIGPDRSLYVSGYQLPVDTPRTNEYGMIIKISSSLKGLEVGEFIVPSRDGSQIYVFNAEGLHDRTLNAYTNSVIYKFFYDSTGLLIRVEDAFGNATLIERNSSGLPMAIVSPFGHRTELGLNPNHFLSFIINPAGNTISFDFTSDGLMTQMTDPKGNSHAFYYNSEGRLIKDEDPEHNLQTLARSEFAQGYSVIHSTAEGRQTNYQVERLNTYYERQVNTFPTGDQTLLDLKKDGSKTIVTSDGVTAVYQQNPDPRFGIVAPLFRISESMPSGSLGFYSDATRQVVLTDPQNPFSVQNITDSISYCTDFDPYNNSCIDADTYRRVYTSIDNKFAFQSPEDRSREILVNEKGLVKQISFPGPSGMAPVSFNYNPQGLINEITWGDMKQTFTYSAMGQVQFVTNAANETTQLSYDSADRITEITTSLGRSYGFRYDPNSNLSRITMPSGAVHELSFNARNLLSGYTLPGSNKSYTWTYNKDRDLVQNSLPSGKSLAFTYDAGGRMRGIEYPEADVQLRYKDSTKHLYQIERRSSSGLSQQIEYAYDGSLLKQMSYSGLARGDYHYDYGKNYLLKEIYFEYDRGSGLGWDWDWIPMVRDRDGLVIEYGDFSLTREPTMGRLVMIGDSGYGIHPLQIDYTYDSLGRLSGRNHTVNGNQIYQLQLTRDNTGRIIQKTDGATYDYSYDKDGQLKEVRKNSTLVEQYVYDLNANRTGTLSDTANFDVQDKILNQGGVYYVHNDDGHLISKGTDSFEYSTRGELLEATINGVKIQYTYDGYGRRVGRRVGEGNWYQYFYGDPRNRHLITATKDESGSFTFYRYDDLGHLFAIVRGPDWDNNPIWYYVATDQVGTPRVLSDTSGNIIKTLEYDSYGRVLFDSNPNFDLPIGFAGGVYDPITGFTRFGYRDYSALIGRWTTKDPILFRSYQLNLYLYAHNDPVSFRDASGLIEPMTVITLTAIGLVGYGIYEGLMSWYEDFAKPLEEAQRRREEVFKNPKALAKPGAAESAQACYQRQVAKTVSEAGATAVKNVPTTPVTGWTDWIQSIFTSWFGETQFEQIRQEETGSPGGVPD